MGLFGKLLKTGLDAASLPLDIIKDAVTMGGICTDQDEPYTFQKIEKLIEDGQEVMDEIEEL